MQNAVLRGDGIFSRLAPNKMSITEKIAPAIFPIFKIRAGSGAAYQSNKAAPRMIKMNFNAFLPLLNFFEYINKSACNNGKKCNGNERQREKVCVQWNTVQNPLISSIFLSSSSVKERLSRALILSRSCSGFDAPTSTLVTSSFLKSQLNAICARL